MIPLLIALPFAVVLVLLCLPQWRKDPRGTVAVPEPERIATVTAAAVEAKPLGTATRPFAYDNGLIIEEDGP